MPIGHHQFVSMAVPVEPGDDMRPFGEVMCARPTDRRREIIVELMMDDRSERWGRTE